MRSSASLALLSACAVLAGCGEVAEPSVQEGDPALATALDEAILTDPDLAALNAAAAAAVLPGQDGTLPTLDLGPEEAAAARAEALRLVGGPGKMRTAPEPVEALLAPLGEHGCAERMKVTMQWAARLPKPFPVYPRGAVQEATGSDVEGCAQRMVNFVTPATLGEVMDFYYTRALAGGFSAERLAEGDVDALRGAKGDASFAIYARALPNGTTAVDLITAG